jgi:phosphoserine phosphatase RsbU/P
MLGVMRCADFPAQSCQIPAGARLLIFSDGVFEIFRDGRAAWNLDACIAYMAALADRQESVMSELVQHVYDLHGSPRLDDDFSIIEARFH